MASGKVRTSQLWQEAVDRYLAKTSRKGATASEPGGPLTSLKTAEDLQSYLETHTEGFDKMREKHGQFFSILSQTVQPLIMASKLTESALSFTPFAPASAFLGALRFLLDASAGVSSALGHVEDLLEKLHFFTQRLKLYSGPDDAGIDADMQEHIVKIFSCLLDVIARTECIILDGRFKKWGKTLFTGEDAELAALLGRLETLIDEERGIVLAIIGTQSRKMARDVDEIGSSVKEGTKLVSKVSTSVADIAASMQDFRLERQAQRQETSINNNLKTGALQKTIARHAQYCEAVLESTGKWLLAEDSFQRWMSRKTPLLWVTGGPGTGKSCLSSIIITALRNAYPANNVTKQDGTNVSIAYFYVKEDEQELRSLENLIKTIAYQIAQADTVFRSHVVGALNNVETTATPRQMWQNLFVSFFVKRSLLNSAMVVLDGLDEMEGTCRRDFFLLLDDLYVNACLDEGQDRPLPRLSFAFFGRRNVRDSFGPRIGGSSGGLLETIEIGDKNQGDIDLYVKKTLPRLLVVKRAQRDRSPAYAKQLALKIRKKIMARADNMFFKVVLILDQIKERERVETVLEAIETIPPKLETMIANVFRPLIRNEDVGKQDFIEILHWISFAKRPLYIAELYAALEMRTGRPYDALESRLRGAFATFLSLQTKVDTGELPGEPSNKEGTELEKDIEVSFDDEDDCELEDPTAGDEDLENAPLNADTLKRLRSTSVSFSHISIRDFLVKSKPANSDDDGHIHIDGNTAHVRIVSVCMQSILDVPRKYTACNLYQYTSDFLVDHFLSIDVASLSLSKMRPVLSQICQTFFSADGVRHLLRALLERPLNMGPMFRKTAFVDSIRLQWLPLAERCDFTDNEWGWITSATASRREFFSPLARAAARGLLTKSGHDDPAYLEDRYQMYHVWIMHFAWRMVSYDTSPSRHWFRLPFQKLQRLLTALQGTEEGIDWSQIGWIAEGKPPPCQVEELEKLLLFYDGERTAHWHTGYGDVLLQREKYDEAMKQFSQAISLDSKSWKAMKGLAACYMWNSKLDDAKDLLQRSMQAVPETLRGAIDYLIARLMRIAITKGEPGEAIEYAKGLTADWPSNYMSMEASEAVRCLFEALYMKRDYPAILARWEDACHRYDLGLTKCEPINTLLLLRGVQDEIGRALYFLGKLSTVRPAIDDLTSRSGFWADMSKSPWIAAWLGEFMYSYYDDVEPALQLFERLLDPAFHDTVHPEMHWALQYPASAALRHLPLQYYAKAAAAAQAGLDADEWLLKLSNIASILSSSLSESAGLVKRVWPELDEPGDIDFEVGPKILLGIYYRVHGDSCEANDEDRKETYRAFFRRTILDAADMLEDEEPSNDSYAYSLLTKYLLAAGDVVNAAAAAAPLFLRRGGNITAEEAEALEQLHFPETWWRCDGCETMFHRYDQKGYSELYFCMECPSKCFCEECFPRIQGGEMGFLRCNPTKHQIVRLFPIPEESKGMAARFDGKRVEVQKEWLEGIRREWSIKPLGETEDERAKNA